jgi:hypothetical protein
MAPLTECPDCDKHFVGSVCACGFSLIRPVREGYQRLTMPAERPCSDAQNKAAWRITMDVMEGKCSAHVGKARLAKLFGMPELVNERCPGPRGGAA